MNRRSFDIKVTLDSVEEHACQWSHLNPETNGTISISQTEFWDGLKRPNSVLFRFQSETLSLSTKYVRAVRDWTHETFEYQPILARLMLGSGLVAFRLTFPSFDDALLCKLRWY